MAATADGAAGTDAMAEPGRAAVRARFDALLAGAAEFSLPDVTDAVLAALDELPEVDRLLWAECRRSVVYALGEQVLARRRSRQVVEQRQEATARQVARAVPVALQTTGADLRARLMARKTKPSRARWFEQPILVARKHYMLLGRMNGDQLDRALGVQERRLVGPIATYNMLVSVRAGLADAAETVDARYTEEELAALWEEAQMAAVGGPDDPPALAPPASADQ